MSQDPSVPPNGRPIKSAELSWNDVFSDDDLPAYDVPTIPSTPDPTDDRTRFRQALGVVSAEARHKLPGSESRISKATAILLAGDCIASEPVRNTEGGVTCRFTVGSSQDVTSHMVSHDDEQGWCCSCADAEHRAPAGLCKHVLASMLWIKTHALLQENPGHSEAHEPGNGAVPPDIERVNHKIHLPESPASVNCHIELAGRRVQVTLRGVDENEVLDRLALLLDRFPPLQPPPDVPTTPTNNTPAEPAPDAEWCGIHSAPMYLRENERGQWWSHQLDDGSYCKGKGGKR